MLGKGGTDWMKKIELMAPAGNREAFIGAINAGADAVYLAGKKFGARAFAPNFDTQEMVDLVKFAHLRGASVYVTVNTLVFNDEVADLLEYTDELVAADVDALIVQDLGMLDLLHRRYPHTPIHASTQTNAHSLAQVRFLKDLGASRVIMARETSLDIIREIKKNVDIEIEVFVHGALCVCYSGNCLFSSMVGHRSGNRGECGQPCRLPYTLLKDGEPVSEESFLMSTKDLMTLDRLSELIDVGIDAFKIEGRMRKPDYVIQSVLSYRNALLSKEKSRPFRSDDEIDKLKRVFNREYTEGYVLNAEAHTLNNAYRPNHMGIEVGTVKSFSHGKVEICLSGDLSVNDGIRIVGTEEKDTGNVVSRIIIGSGLVPIAHPGDVILLDSADPVSPGSVVLKTLDHNLVRSLDIYLDPDWKMIPLWGTARIVVGEPMEFDIHDGDGHNVKYKTEFIVQPAQTAPMDQNAIRNQLGKLGNTPFYWESLQVDTDGNGFIPVKVLNEFRRDAIDKMTGIRAGLRRNPTIVPESSPIIVGQGEEFTLSAKVRTAEQLDACLDAGIRVIYHEENLKIQPEKHPEVRFYTQKRRIWPEKATFSLSESSLVSEVGSLWASAHGLGKNGKLLLFGDQFLNVTNIYTAGLLLKSGLSGLTLSLELQKDRIQNFSSLFIARYGGNAVFEQIVYGRTELMISKYCPISKVMGANQKNCHLCEHSDYSLKDRMDFEFPLLNDGDCNIRVLNPKPLCLIDHLDFFRDSGISRVRMEFTVESGKETESVIEAFQHALRKEPYSLNRRGMTYGRFQH